MLLQSPPSVMTPVCPEVAGLEAGKKGPAVSPWTDYQAGGEAIK